MKKALITGITEQDGSYLQSFCWKKAMRCTALPDVLPFRIQQELTI